MMVSDPDWRPGMGIKKPTLGLGDNASDAYVAWRELYNERIYNEPGQRVHAGDVAAAVARQDQLGEMFRLAAWDAGTRALPTDTERPCGGFRSVDRAGWEIAQKLYDIQQSNPALREPLFGLVEDACRHGVPIAGVCDKCEEAEL